MRVAAVLLGALLLAACGTEGGPAPTLRAARPVVRTTFHPTTYLATRLAAGDAEVHLPLPEGEDPVSWRPDPATIRAYQRADLVVLNGADLEGWVRHASLVPSRTVESARPFRSEWATHERTVEHRHGPEGAHAHEGIDGHTWLDPLLAKEQAREIARALERLLPDRVAALRERLAALETDLDDLHARFQRATRDGGKVVLFTAHPAYAYLARRYGLRLVDFAFDPDATPSEADLSEVRARIAETPARVMLWEREPAAGVAEAFRALGLSGVVVSPAENPSRADLAAGEDYLAVMRRNAEALEGAIARSSGG